MMKLALATLVLASVATVTVADYDAPVITIDLDLPPRQRWYNATRMVLNTHGWSGSFGPIMDYLYSKVPEKIIDAADPFLAQLDLDFGPEFGEEVRGVFDVMQELGFDKSQNMTLGRLCFMQIIYEATAFCTSIVAQPESTSTGPVHGRNLDYGFPGLANLTATARFTSNGSVSYYGTAFIGYVGLLTGMRPQKYSISIDQRDKDNNSIEQLLANILSAETGGRALGFFIRNTLAKDKWTYDTAVDRLNTTQLVAPVYIIIGGAEPNQGAVITRDRDHADDSHGTAMGVRTIQASGTFYCLETNYDWWVPAPSTDDRRDPAVKMMNAVGASGVSASAIQKVLSTAPVLNDHTKYTAVMSASTGTYHTIVRTH